MSDQAEQITREPVLMKSARGLGRTLPFARSFIVRSTAAVLGARRFAARVEGGLIYEIDFRERVSRHLYMFGNIEPVIGAIFRGILQPGATVLDVGANFGYFSLLAGSLVGAAGKVIAFEPDPRNLARLRRNIALNHMSQVEVMPVGVYDADGTLKFHLAREDEDNLGTSSLLDAREGREQIDVRVITLDHFVRERGLTNIALLKMDIEGAEWGAIRGAMETLRAGIVRHVLVEVHTGVLGAEKSRQVVAMLRGAGLIGYAIDEAKAHVQTWRDYLAPLEAQGELLNPHYLFTR